MAYKKNENCMVCRSCLHVCPTNAISESEYTMVVDPKLCVECEGYYKTNQCADVCPWEACVHDPDYPVKNSPPENN